MNFSFAHAACAVTLAASSAFATTYTVDDSGGADFTTISAALLVAVDGDVIVVRPGSYSAFTTPTDVGLVIRAETPGTVQVVGATSISSVQAPDVVELNGLNFVPTSGVPQALGVTGVATLFVRACTARGANGVATFSGRNGRPAAQIWQSNVVLHTSTFTGGEGADGDPWIGFGGHGAILWESTSQVLDSTFKGGNGGEDFDGDEHGGNGGAGLLLVGGSTRASRTTFTGGHGGFGGFDNFLLECKNAGAGGAGVELSQTLVTSFEAHAVTYQPGSRGPFMCDSGNQPPPFGAPVDGGVAGVAQFVPYCFGHPTACPCGGGITGLQGCGSSLGLGATLTASGTASVAADDVHFQAAGLTPGSALLFQGALRLGVSGAGVLFGDGLRCAGGASVRLATRTVAGGAASFGPSAGDGSLSAAGGVPATGGARFYQVWYRDTAAHCTSEPFNLTHAVEVVWTP